MSYQDLLFELIKLKNKIEFLENNETNESKQFEDKIEIFKDIESKEIKKLQKIDKFILKQQKKIVKINNHIQIEDIKHLNLINDLEIVQQRIESKKREFIARESKYKADNDKLLTQEKQIYKLRGRIYKEIEGVWSNTKQVEEKLEQNISYKSAVVDDIINMHNNFIDSFKLWKTILPVMKVSYHERNVNLCNIKLISELQGRLGQWKSLAETISFIKDINFPTPDFDNPYTKTYYDLLMYRLQKSIFENIKNLKLNKIDELEDSVHQMESFSSKLSKLSFGVVNHLSNYHINSKKELDKYILKPYKTLNLNSKDPGAISSLNLNNFIGELYINFRSKYDKSLSNIEKKIGFIPTNIKNFDQKLNKRKIVLRMASQLKSLLKHNKAGDNSKILSNTYSTVIKILSHPSRSAAVISDVFDPDDYDFASKEPKDFIEEEDADINYLINFKANIITLLLELKRVFLMHRINSHRLSFDKYSIFNNVNLFESNAKYESSDKLIDDISDKILLYYRYLGYCNHISLALDVSPGSVDWYYYEIARASNQLNKLSIANEISNSLNTPEKSPKSSSFGILLKKLKKDDTIEIKNTEEKIEKHDNLKSNAKETSRLTLLSPKSISNQSISDIVEELGISAKISDKFKKLMRMLPKKRPSFSNTTNKFNHTNTDVKVKYFKNYPPISRKWRSRSADLLQNGVDINYNDENS